MSITEFRKSRQCSDGFGSTWWCLYQTLGRAYLGFGQLQESVLAFSKAVHLCPDNEELRTEDLAWAADLLAREKAGNREWKPVKEPEQFLEDEEYFITEEELDRLRNHHA